jgi:O-acetylserine/cysteine efflux transporter
MKLKDVFLILLVIVIWGVNFPIIKIGLEELPPMLFTALRFTVVALPAIFFIPFPKTSIWNVIGVGVFLGILQFGLLFIAMKSDASAGLSSLILQAQVFFTIALSAIVFKETVNKLQLVGICIAAIGFSCFFLGGAENITSTGLILILLAALSWSISNIIMKQTKDINLLHFMVWVCLVPPLPLLALSYSIESSQPVALLMSINIKTLGALLYVSYLSTLVAYILWGKVLKTYSAATVTPFALLIPVVGMITSNLMLNESLQQIELIGAGLIMLGLLVSVLGNKILKSLSRRALNRV